MASLDVLGGFLDDASGGSAAVTGLVGTRVVADTDLPDAASDVALRVVLGTGAGGLAGPVKLADRRGLRVAAYQVALRDALDPVGNARRVVAAAEGAGADPQIHVLVDPEPSHGWLAAADELAAAELFLAVPLTGDVEGWADAALDRELPFSLVGGTVVDAVAALRLTARLWGGPDELTAARRWCRSWTCTDLDSALAHLEALR